MGGKHNKCCCGGCAGCCLPFNDPDGSCPSPGRRVKNLAWAISAPFCPALDGLTGTLSPETTCPHNTIGPCGNCLCMVNTTHASSFVLGKAYYVESSDVFKCNPDPLPCCATTPCGSIGMCFNLACNPNTPLLSDVDVAACCSRLKLLVLINGAEVVTGGDEVIVEGNECLDVTELDGQYTNFLGCPGNEGSILRQLDPVSCECEDEDTMTEFEVVYDLSEFSFSCEDPPFSGGPCDGLPQCCLPDNCTLAGATLTVIVGE